MGAVTEGVTLNQRSRAPWPGPGQITPLPDASPPSARAHDLSSAVTGDRPVRMLQGPDARSVRLRGEPGTHAAAGDVLLPSSTRARSWFGSMASSSTDKAPKPFARLSDCLFGLLGRPMQKICSGVTAIRSKWISAVVRKSPARSARSLAGIDARWIEVAKMVNEDRSLFRLHVIGGLA